MSIIEMEILAPDAVVERARVRAIRGTDASGRFGLWPNHERFLTVLVPCVLTYRIEDGRERHVAVDGGVLYLEGNRASVVTRDAVAADRLDEVADAAAGMLRARREQEQAVRSAFAGLEASLLRELRRAEGRA